MSIYSAGGDVEKGEPPSEDDVEMGDEDEGSGFPEFGAGADDDIPAGDEEEDAPPPKPKKKDDKDDKPKKDADKDKKESVRRLGAYIGRRR